MDDAWKLVEIEPEAVEVNGNGHHANRNGYHDAIGLTVELVLVNEHHGNGNGHAAATVNGNGHHVEADEPQQTLFSWAEFMTEEPVKPMARSRNPQPVGVVNGRRFRRRNAPRFHLPPPILPERVGRLVRGEYGNLREWLPNSQAEELSSILKAPHP